MSEVGPLACTCACACTCPCACPAGCKARTRVAAKSSGIVSGVSCLAAPPTRGQLSLDTGTERSTGLPGTFLPKSRGDAKFQPVASRQTCVGKCNASLAPRCSFVVAKAHTYRQHGSGQGGPELGRRFSRCQSISWQWRRAPLVRRRAPLVGSLSIGLRLMSGSLCCLPSLDRTRRAVREFPVSPVRTPYFSHPQTGTHQHHP